MVEAFSGKWRVDVASTTGLEEFGAAMGYTQEKIAKSKALSYTIEFTSSGDTHTAKVEFGLPGNPVQTYSFKLGEEFDYKSLDGDLSKLTITLDGNKLVESYKSGDKQYQTTREVHGNSMTVKNTAKGATMVQTFNRV